ncbi:hypothetical protein CDL15_Pgr022604 [Punica granatum]|uniref:60S ribosomal protein L7a n=1 Tax=Punica granatum TaxID=22663 RepID=A0A218XRC1_PUNGR|nr:hypothetical protein CDL15_Pgr022604 [Punica granatum]PKI74732.1 hypothetical protein CRG98_005059 [Punica granatum]
MQFGIGGALPPKRNLTRFVKFPKTVQIQRKSWILKQRLKVPPTLNQFTKTLDKNLGHARGCGQVMTLDVPVTLVDVPELCSEKFAPHDSGMPKIQI